MAQELLDGGHIHAGVKGVRSEGVAEQVRMYPGIKPGPDAEAMDDPLDRPRLQGGGMESWS